MPSPLSNVKGKTPAFSKPRKQPYRRPVDNAGYAVAKHRTLELWTQLDETLAREDLREARQAHKDSRVNG